MTHGASTADQASKAQAEARAAQEAHAQVPLTEAVLLMDVKARAVILVDGRLAITRQRRRDQPYNALPGGRVRAGEGALEALIRELREEADLEVRPGRLLYVAEVLAPAVIHDINLVFLASAPDVDESEHLELIEPGSRRPLFPPLLCHIAADLPDGFVHAPRWLGNVWDPSLLRVREP